MKKLLLAAAAFGLVALSSADAATAKKPAAKPAPKAAKPAPQPAVISSVQLKGDQAQFDQEYSLGKEEPVNVIVRSAEYSISRVVNGTQVYYPAANEKLLVLRLTLRNPLPHERLMRWDSLKFTAIDAANTNHDGDQVIIRDGQGLEMMVKPAQKVDVFTVIKIPAKGEIPKVMIKSSDDLVLRYDMKGKIKKLEAPFADSSDPSGTTALAVVPSKLGVACDLGEYDFQLDSFEYTTEPPKETELGEGKHYLLVRGVLKNACPTEKFTRYDGFEPTVTTADGDDIAFEKLMELGGRHEWVDLTMKPGQEIKVRIYFEMGNDVKPKTFTMKMPDNSRAYAWDVSGVK